MMENGILKNQYTHLARRSRRLRADGIYEEAHALHRQCLKIAREMQDEVRIASCHFWLGECLYQLGRKEEALLILAPNLASSAKGSPDDLYNSMSKYIIIALDIPASKKTIEDAIELTWSYLRKLGRLEWQHKLLYLEAELYQSEGKRELALDRALEAWAEWRNTYPLFVADAHFYQITMLQLRLGRADDAEKTIKIWEANKDDAFPTYRQAVLNRSRSYLSRLWGDYELATYQAERAVQLTKQMHTPESLATMLSASAYASMLNDDFDSARQALQGIPSHIIKERSIVIADYHLNRARMLCGLPPVDIVLRNELPDVPEKLKASADICHELSRARMMYRVALKRAKRFDDAFDCTWRQDEIKDCLAHIDALENALSPIA